MTENTNNPQDPNGIWEPCQPDRPAEPNPVDADANNHGEPGHQTSGGKADGEVPNAAPDQ